MSSFETKDNEIKGGEMDDATAPDERIKIAHDSILSDGYYLLEDASFGELVQKLDSADIDLWTVQGLDSFDTAILQDELASNIIKSFFSWCGLSNYLYMNARPGNYTFLNEPAAILDCLIIRWVGINSTLTIWKESHKYALPSIDGENKFWLVPTAPLKALAAKEGNGVEGLTHTFPNGGLLITAPGTAVETSQGRVIGSIIGSHHAFQAWRRKKVPYSAGLEECISKMKRSWFGVVVELI